MTTSASKLRIPPSIGDMAKRVFLGKPLITESLTDREAVESRCARRAFAGRDLVDRLRHRADPDRTAAGCGPGGVCAVASHHRRHLGDSGVGDRVVSAGGHGLHPSGRVLHRGAGELRAPGGAGRRRGAVDRLCGHGGGAGGGGHGRGGVGDPGVGSPQPANHGRLGAFHLLREPTRAEGSGIAVRIPNLLLHRHGRSDDRGRCRADDIGRSTRI